LSIIIGCKKLKNKVYIFNRILQLQTQMPTMKECIDTIYVAAFLHTMDIDNIKYEDTPFEATKQKNYNFLVTEFTRLHTNGLNNYDALVQVLELSRKRY